MKRLRVRFSVCSNKLPGNPDIVIPRLKLAIFVNGCFWHWHGCKRSRMPQANEAYWRGKIAGNVRRDRRNRRLLSALGWRYCTIWECSIGRGMARVERRVERLRQALE
jgi:DNA mismatch endonuclease (patch repair protein)